MSGATGRPVDGAPGPNAPEGAELICGGRVFGAWMSLSVNREITKLVTDFDITVTERENFPIAAWQVPPFEPCEIRLLGVTVLTGYVDAIFPSYDHRTKSIRLVGRSKTADLVDCSSEIGSEFKGTTLDAIARAVCGPFGIEVVVETDMGEPFATAAMEVTETAFQFLERLCRMRGVLATDDARGRLVLTRAGSKQASGALWQGDNIMAMQVQINVSKRHSKYIFKGQAPSAAATSTGSFGGFNGTPTGEAQRPGGGAQPAVLGVATDSAVPRYRPRIFQAEHALTTAGALERAQWQAAHASGRSTRARITVQGWQQDDSRLWQINEVIPVKSPWVRIDDDLLIAGVTYQIDAEKGRTTELELGLASGYTPEPVKVKREKAKKSQTGASFAGFGRS